MVIELNIARRVVSELHDAIRQPINLMDENGRIIASTDASRIGTVHSARPYGRTWSVSSCGRTGNMPARASA